MIQLTQRMVRQWLSALLHTHDTPRRTAASFALGVLVGFSPLFGAHTAIGLILAFALRLNRLAMLIGVYANLPWFIAPYYTLATLGGAWLLGVAPPPQIGEQLTALFDVSVFSRAFWTGTWILLRPLLWPFVVGSTLGALGLAAAAYLLAVPAIATGRRHIHLPHRNAHGPESS